MADGWCVDEQAARAALIRNRSHFIMLDTSERTNEPPKVLLAHSGLQSRRDAAVRAAKQKE